MLKYPCLVLDHDDTVVQSEATVNYPFFVYILDQYRPGTTITLEEYVEGCCHLGFADMCRKWYGFSDQELVDEFRSPSPVSNGSSAATKNWAVSSAWSPIPAM